MFIKRRYKYRCPTKKIEMVYITEKQEHLGSICIFCEKNIGEGKDCCSATLRNISFHDKKSTKSLEDHFKRRKKTIAREATNALNSIYEIGKRLRTSR